MNAKQNESTKCVQCGVEMDNEYGNEYITLPFCNEPQCANYGLLQTTLFKDEREQ